MVILKDLFNWLATGEFSNITLSRTATGNLDEKDYDKVIGHINLGVLEMHKRFCLMQKELNLFVCPEVTRYYLRRDRVATRNNMNKKTYIEDTFIDNDEDLNIIEVLHVFDPDGTDLEINNRFSIPTISTLTYDSLKIIGIDYPQTLGVVYQSYPNKITMDEDFDPAEYELDIPEIIVEPLLYYVAARTYHPMGANESTASADKSATYQQQYELACQKIALYGLDSQVNDDPDTFASEGWA